MKLCKTCNTEKDFSSFYTNGHYIKKDGTKTQKYKPKCKECENRTRLERRFIWMQEALRSLGKDIACEKCGYDKSWASLDFHHINPLNKDFTISKLTTVSEAKLKQEIAKCSLLCANCHREEHVKYPDIYKIDC